MNIQNVTCFFGQMKLKIVSQMNSIKTYQTRLNIPHRIIFGGLKTLLYSTMYAISWYNKIIASFNLYHFSQCYLILKNAYPLFLFQSLSETPFDHFQFSSCEATLRPLVVLIKSQFIWLIYGKILKSKKLACVILNVCENHLYPMCWHYSSTDLLIPLS